MTEASINMKRRKLPILLIVIGLLWSSFLTIQPVQALDRDITIHYQRYDGNYDGWNIWAWVDGEEGQEYPFTDQDDFGMVATFTLESSQDFSKVGFIIKLVEDGNIWARKDVDMDRFIEQFKPDGSAEIWVIQETEGFQYDQESAVVEHRIRSANMMTNRSIIVNTNTPITSEDVEELRLNIGEIEKVDRSTMTLTIHTTEDIDITEQITVDFGRYGRRDVSIHEYVHTEQFNDQFTYDGPLGVSYSKDQSTFHLWAPTAQEVTLQLDDQELVMDKKDRGLWQVEVQGDHNLKTYVYKLKFATSEVVSVDPYARAVTINGEKGVIVSPDDMDPENYSNSRMPSFSNNVDAVIYEAHVRDLTIGVDNGIENKGKFLGLTELGTTTDAGNPTGLSYIKNLGVSHVQLLPIYDFASIDEEGPLGFDEAYNWGYDPMNYNVPEGSYSTDPSNPLSRIHELKRMIQTFHEHDLYVIMDVVYNHVYDVNRSPLHKTFPYYYFRYSSEGSLLNGTGVGNETASEQPMFQRFILDSTKYWLEEYNIDGFRFDLMGIHDIETMNKVRQQVDEIDPSIIILGEGWDMGFLPANQRANQKNAKEVEGIAFFNDSMRDLIKGSVFDAKDGGFVNGKASTEVMVTMNLLGAQRLPVNHATYQSPAQVIQYVEAHDNLTLFDKLVASKPNDDAITRQKRHNLATSMVLLSQGIPFIHAGQEILRTKQGDENSYISPDSINVFDYDRQLEYPKSLKMVKDLIQFREDHPIFRLNDYIDINSRTNILETSDRIIAYQLLDQKQTYTIIFNANEQEKTVVLPMKTDYQILVDGLFVSHQTPLETLTGAESVTVNPLTAMVLVNASENPVEATKPPVLNPWLTTILVVVGIGLVYVGYKIIRRKK